MVNPGTTMPKSDDDIGPESNWDGRLAGGQKGCGGVLLDSIRCGASVCHEELSWRCSWHPSRRICYRLINRRERRTHDDLTASQSNPLMVAGFLCEEALCVVSMLDKTV